MLMISSSSSIRKTALSASSTSRICSLPFWQGSPSLKQWIKPSSEPLVLRFKPHDLNKLEKGWGGGGGGGVIRKGRLENNMSKKGGVYSREGFSRGRAFIRCNTVTKKMVRKNTNSQLSNVKQFINSIIKIFPTMDKQLTPVNLFGEKKGGFP